MTATPSPALCVAQIRLTRDEVDDTGRPIPEACRKLFDATFTGVPDNAPVRVELLLGPVTVLPFRDPPANLVCPVRPILLDLWKSVRPRPVQLHVKGPRHLVAESWAQLWNGGPGA
ncbi:hypothetical protein TESS_TESS_00850 [Tessaracoccus sp. O5.2]|uniref:hypothetical protein n=1 Tax=Tessaracoccus sp. O5.2 TaxID=3157622 RepID=UPI0035E9C3D4